MNYVRSVMAPNAQHHQPTEYECYVCRNRVVDPDRPVCEECGSDLLNISRARDL